MLTLSNLALLLTVQSYLLLTVEVPSKINSKSRSWFELVRRYGQTS